MNGEHKSLSGKIFPRALYVGCAGWSIAKEHASLFPPEGSHLERYAARFPAVEINSSFYRPHRPATYARWAASVPQEFRFAVKVPRDITHKSLLAGTADVLERFLDEVQNVGNRLGPLLFQLPPRFAFDRQLARTFFAALRQRFRGSVVCEPRHASWFAPEVETMLADFEVARVAGDPAVVPDAAVPGGWTVLRYYR